MLVSVAATAAACVTPWPRCCPAADGVDSACRNVCVVAAVARGRVPFLIVATAAFAARLAAGLLCVACACVEMNSLFCVLLAALA